MANAESKSKVALNNIFGINEYQHAANYLKEYVSKKDFVIQIDRKAVEKVYETFQNKFSPAVLEKLTDKELLNTMFISNDSQRDSLCNWLEFNNDVVNFCGSIAGGSSYKYGLFQKKKDGTWVTGSANSAKELTGDEALSLGKKIRDALVAGCKIIEKSELNSLSDYEKLDEDLFKLGPISCNYAWIHKYFSMIFPHKLCNYHSEEWQRHVLYALNIRPSDKSYARSGQISMVSELCNWLPAEFSEVFVKRFGDIKKFYKLGSLDDDGHYGDDWQKQGIVAIGWPELGNLENYLKDNVLNKVAIADKLKNLVYKTPHGTATATSKAGEIINFYETDKNSIFVVTDGQRLLGLVDNLGEYNYAPENKNMPNQKKGTWHMCFEKGARLIEPVICTPFTGHSVNGVFHAL